MSSRLKVIAELVEPCAVVADVGTDHAFLAVDLIKQGKAKRVIASDINVGPLKNAENTIDKARLNDKIELRLGSGLAPYQIDEVDTYIIAGMGGELIADIIEKDKKKALSSKALILQPMQQQAVLRRYLLANGFAIVSERIVIEGSKYYQLIVAKASSQKQEWHEFADEFGIRMLVDDNYKRFLAFELRRNQSILDKLNPLVHKEQIDLIRAKIAYIRSIV